MPPRGPTTRLAVRLYARRLSEPFQNGVSRLGSPALLPQPLCWADYLHALLLRDIIKNAATETLPEQPHLVSLQHAKKNVGQQCKWKFGNKTKMVNRWQENTASWPGYVFSFTWRRLQPLLCVGTGNRFIGWCMLSIYSM